VTPRTFRDNKGRMWTVAVPYNMIVKVLGETGLDLRQLVEDHDHVARELDDPVKLRAVLAVLLADQLTNTKITIDDLLQEIVSEEQATAMVIAVYQGSFDFFQSQGGVMNDALSRVQRAQETAKAAAAARMKTSIDDGRMDAYLAIVTDPNVASQWILASQNPANVAIVEAWNQVVEAGVEPAKRLSAFARLIVEYGLTLPMATSNPIASNETASSSSTIPTPNGNNQTAKELPPSWKPATSSTSVGGSPASVASTPVNTPGDSSN
jgi:hypothetical protein